MAEHRLHAAQVGAALEEMAREGMPERVGRHARAQPGAPGAALENAPEALAGEGPAARVEEEHTGVETATGDAASAIQVATHPLQSLGAHRHETLAAPLARADHVAGSHVQILHPQGEDLRRAHAGGVHQLQQGAVAQAVGAGGVRRFNEGGDVLDRQGARQPPRRAGALDLLGGIAPHHAFAQQVPVEPAQSGEPSRHAARPEPPAAQREQIVAHVARGERAQRAARALEIPAEVGEVAPVREQGVARGPPLRLEGLEILDYRIHLRLPEGVPRPTEGDATTGPAYCELPVHNELYHRERVPGKSSLRISVAGAACRGPW